MRIIVLLNILLDSSALLAFVGLLAVATKLVRDSRGTVGAQAKQIVIRVPPPLVEQAIYNVVSIGIQAQDAEERVQSALETDSPQAQRNALGAASVLMSSLQEKAFAAVEDLKHLVPDTVNRMIELGNELPR